jgi:hypothetical protein
MAAVTTGRLPKMPEDARRSTLEESQGPIQPFPAPPLPSEALALSGAGHIDELRATLGRPRVAEPVKPHQAGRPVNQVRKLAEDIVPSLPWNALPIPRTIFCWRSVKPATPTISSPATRSGYSR